MNLNKKSYDNAIQVLFYDSEINNKYVHQTVTSMSLRRQEVSSAKCGHISH